MKGLLLLFYPVIVIAMMKFALYSYIPQRFQRRTTFEEQDICRMIIGFKDGRNVYTRWAARQFSKALALISSKCRGSTTASNLVHDAKALSCI